MSSPHGSLLCSHWKCAAVVCEVNRMEHFRCCWKTLLLKPSKWAQRRRSLSPAFLYLFLSLSLCVCYPFVLISSVFLLSSYLISSCLFFFFLSAWTDMCSLTTGTTNPSSVSSAPLNLPTRVAWRATCIRRTQVKRNTQTHTLPRVFESCVHD